MPGHRRGAIPRDSASSMPTSIVGDVPISSVIDMVDEVHVNTSLAGFEALLRGKPVNDLRRSILRRMGTDARPRTRPGRRTAVARMDELVAASLAAISALPRSRYRSALSGRSRRVAPQRSRRAMIPALIVTMRRLQGKLMRRLRSLAPVNRPVGNLNLFVPTDPAQTAGSSSPRPASAKASERRAFLFLRGHRGRCCINSRWIDARTWDEGRAHQYLCAATASTGRSCDRFPRALLGTGRCSSTISYASIEITDILLFGDCRPYHVVRAPELRPLRGVRTYVLEEGYLRPHWMTLELDGVNGHSRLARE